MQTKSNIVELLHSIDYYFMPGVWQGELMVVWIMFSCLSVEWYQITGFFRFTLVGHGSGRQSWTLIYASNCAKVTSLLVAMICLITCIDRSLQELSMLDLVT